jgi:hypothetical protein
MRVKAARDQVDLRETAQPKVIASDARVTRDAKFQLTFRPSEVPKVLKGWDYRPAFRVLEEIEAKKLAENERKVIGPHKMKFLLHHHDRGVGFADQQPLEAQMKPEHYCPDLGSIPNMRRRYGEHLFKPQKGFGDYIHPLKPLNSDLAFDRTKEKRPITMYPW